MRAFISFLLFPSAALRFWHCGLQIPNYFFVAQAFFRFTLVGGVRLWYGGWLHGSSSLAGDGMWLWLVTNWVIGLVSRLSGDK